MKYAMPKLITACALSLGLLWSGAAVAADAAPATPDAVFESIQSAADAAGEAKEDATAAMRQRAMRQAARIYGTQHGWRARWEDLQTKLFARDRELSTIFDFGAFYMRGGKLQPPVLDVGAELSEITDEGTLYRLVDREYRVVVQSRFSHLPLSWRSFLLPETLEGSRAFEGGGEPRPALLPRDETESAIWKQEIAAGWEEGREQASAEFSERLAALNKAYQGMVLYKTLALMGMIAPPQTTEITHPVTASDNGERLTIGERERVIARQSYFVDEPGSWSLFEQREWSE